MKRAFLTSRERAALALKQGGKCACCSQKLRADAIAEHIIPVALGNDRKPTELWCARCAKRKTKADMAVIAKAKRQARETGPQRPNKRKGFKGWRKFNGEIVWRRP